MKYEISFTQVIPGRTRMSNYKENGKTIHNPKIKDKRIEELIIGSKRIMRMTGLRNLDIETITE